jgi:hypothetical protein
MKSKLVIATFSSGSTYLQRCATVWMRELHDPATVNPHELLNGIGRHTDGYLIKQWSDVNAQSLSEIQRMLVSSPTPVVARLSYDHLLNRRDSPDAIRSFCGFLADYFDVYVSRRDNLFDYGMCWAVRRQTDREPQFQINNVHTPADRARLYGQQQFRVDADLVPDQAAKYLKYVDWTLDTFPLAKVVHYRDLEYDIDAVLQQLMPSSSSISERFGISITQYTNMGYNISNGRTKRYTAEQLASWQQFADYQTDLCNRQILLDPIPIKSTTMQDKLDKVTNIPECIDTFNNWARQQTRTVMPVSMQYLQRQAQHDNEIYQS